MSGFLYINVGMTNFACITVVLRSIELHNQREHEMESSPNSGQQLYQEGIRCESGTVPAAVNSRLMALQKMPQAEVHVRKDIGTMF